MEITYAGHSCFKIKGKNATVVFDPFNPESTGYKLPKLEADIVCISHSHDDHNYSEAVKGTEEGTSPYVISGPGEYDLKGVYVQGFQTFHDNKKGEERGKNTAYYVRIDDMFILHLGDLGHFPEKSMLEEIEDVHVLLVPVGGIYTIDYKMASDIVSEFEPNYVIPMHYRTEKLTVPKASEMDPVDKFVEEFGKDVARKEPKLKLTGKSDMPEETQIIVLEW